MDHENLAALRRLAPDDAARDKVRLLRSFDPASGSDDIAVPDPYFGGDDGFRHAFDLIDAACLGLVEHLRAGPLAAA
jgi:protein-tyrosine phosphatase